MSVTDTIFPFGGGGGGFGKKSFKNVPVIFYMSVCLSVCLSVCKYPRTSERVFIKYGSNRTSTTNTEDVNVFLEVFWDISLKICVKEKKVYTNVAKRNRNTLYGIYTATVSPAFLIQLNKKTTMQKSDLLWQFILFYILHRNRLLNNYLPYKYRQYSFKYTRKNVPWRWEILMTKDSLRVVRTRINTVIAESWRDHQWPGSLVF